MPTILIADNHPHVLLMLDRLVRSIEQTEVVTADNGLEAVDLALRQRPVLILMALDLPELDGYRACLAIRDGWAGHPGQIWFVTARHDLADLDQARQVGADRIINTPFDPDQLMDDVRTLLEPITGCTRPLPLTP